MFGSDLRMFRLRGARGGWSYVDDFVSGLILGTPLLLGVEFQRASFRGVRCCQAWGREGHGV